VRHVRRMRRIHFERQSAMIAAVRQEFADDVEIANADSGLNLVLWLPPKVSDVEAQRIAWNTGVFTFPISSIFYTTPNARSGLVLGFAGLTPPKIRSGVRKLQAALSRLGIAKR
jgi:GntR family transcriptional regulator/MocR family aminotransferase